MIRGPGYLRGFRVYPGVRQALCAARERLGARIVHFSVQSDHLHLLVEARDQIALGRAMKGFGVRVARRLNRLAGRTGRVIAERFHARYLRTPSEVRRALVYVLQNGAKHGQGDARQARGLPWVDPFCSAAFFSGWNDRCRRWIPPRDAPDHPLHRWGSADTPVAAPRSWLLRRGWLRAGGPIDVAEQPILKSRTTHPGGSRGKPGRAPGA